MNHEVLGEGLAPGRAAAVHELSRNRRIAVLLISCLSLFMAGLDVTVVNVALPSIAADLHSSIPGLQWTVDAYTVVLAGLLMLCGSAGDRLGRSPRPELPGRCTPVLPPRATQPGGFSPPAAVSYCSSASWQRPAGRASQPAVSPPNSTPKPSPATLDKP